MVFGEKICRKRIYAYLCNPKWDMAYRLNHKCGNSSVGRARPCQGRGREFKSRFPLQIEDD